jgi:hypothetical protein
MIVRWVVPVVLGKVVRTSHQTWWRISLSRVRLNRHMADSRDKFPHKDNTIVIQMFVFCGFRLADVLPRWRPDRSMWSNFSRPMTMTPYGIPQGTTLVVRLPLVVPTAATGGGS